MFKSDQTGEVLLVFFFHFLHVLVEKKKKIFSLKLVRNSKVHKLTIIYNQTTKFDHINQATFFIFFSLIFFPIGKGIRN
jgi:hypothetical protein